MKKKLIKIGVPFLIGGGIGGLAVPLFLKTKPDLSAINPAAAVGAFLLAFFLQVVLHEAGHLVFGKLAGLKFYSFRIAFLALERENDRIKFKLYRNVGYLGLCIMLPTRLESTRKDLMLYMTGGLFMNLLSFLVCLYLIFQASLSLGFYAYLVYSTAFISILLFAGNILPQKTSGNMVTDGQYIFDGLRQNQNYQNFTTFFNINALSMSGAAPETFMPAYLNRHQFTQNPTYKVNYLVYEYYYHLDQNNDEAAVEAILQTEPHLQEYPATSRKDIQKELLFTYSALRPDPAKARQLFEEVKTRLETSPKADNYRVRAAHALYVLQDSEQALEYIQKGQQVVEKLIMKSFVPVEKKLLTSLEKAAKSEVLAEAQV